MLFNHRPMMASTSADTTPVAIESPLRLLIVEDSLLDLELIILMLKESNIAFTFDVVDTVAACEQNLQQNSYNAVLSDYRLAGFTAYQTLDLLHQSGQDIPLILVTGTLGEEAAVDCIKAGMTDYVLKDRLFRLPMVLARSLREFELYRQQKAFYAQIQQQAQQEQLLNQISRTLNSSLDPDYILQEIVRLTGECFQVDRVIILSVDEQVKILTEWRSNDQVPSVNGGSLMLTECSGLLEPESPLYIYKVLHSPDYENFLKKEKFWTYWQVCQAISTLRVPIIIRDQLFGGFALNTTTASRTFTDDEIHLLQRIAEQTAIALFNAQSYEYLEQLVQKRTQELEREKQLSEAANRAKSDFLAHMSHELRTPLTGILGFSSVLLKQMLGPLTDKQKQYVEGISSCGKHLLDLINDLLDLSKVEAGREELFIETVVVQEICDACIHMIREVAMSRGLQLDVSIAPDVTVCSADKRRLRQILFNLLSNGVKFTEMGSVRLEVSQCDRILQFVVIDTGIGIAPDDVPKLFQSFQQLDSGLARKYEGTGLGLVLARKLAQLHGGDITVESTLGEGSRFTLHLPLDN